MSALCAAVNNIMRIGNNDSFKCPKLIFFKLFPIRFSDNYNN